MTGVTFVVAGWKDWSVTDVLTGKHPDAQPMDRLANFHAAQQLGTLTADAGSDSPSPGSVRRLGGDVPTPHLLLQLAYTAQNQFSLHVGEFCPPEHCFGTVHHVHAPNSYHYKGRAFDTSGSQANMRAFAAYADDNYGPQLTELFWNGPGARNRKNGAREPAGFVSDHTDHVHVAV